MEDAPLYARLPPADDVSGDTLLEGFLDYVTDLGLELYPAQEEAVLELFAGRHVILNTPTGSGKSLVAAALAFKAVAEGRRLFYTAPIKALVSEKFFDLCKVLGPERVGMMTGDATVNRDASVIACTAEILSNMALRQGEDADVDYVVMDEFHYYADRDRGVAWQVPLLELPHATFLLMSATLGETTFFEEDITARTGRPTVLVKSVERPVPLDYAYRETPIHETIDELLSEDRAPIYIVHFTQRSAAEAAQSLMSTDFLTREQKQAIKAQLVGFRFDSPFGKEMKRWVPHGVGVHHAGVLPKYRRLVEKLAQSGLLKVICGTDTLGVGVNIPIRTVLFTKLCKYDGEKTRVLSVRDFKQIAGRAGRRGFDVRGSVVAQAPEHAIENRMMRMKAEGDAKKTRKLRFKKPPDKGYAHWDEDTFGRLVGGEPERLSSSFQVSHGMMINVLSRGDDGCAALKRLIRSCHDGPSLRRAHGRTAIAMFRSLVEAEIVEMHARGVSVNEDLQSDFSLNDTLSLFVIEAIARLDVESADYAADVLTVVESVQENPGSVLLRQLDKIKTDAVAQMKADGVEYEDRMKRLDELDYPKPRSELLYGVFDEFRKKHPWAGADNVRPKSIARQMWEGASTFNEYVKEYGLARSEGVLLRYLSNTYRALVQNVPEGNKTDEVYDICDWLSAILRSIDSSLIDEWERMLDPEAAVEAPPEDAPLEAPDITANEKQLTALVRNECFRLVKHLARREYDRAAAMVESPADDPWAAERVEEALAAYWDEHGEIRTDPVARSPRNTRIESASGVWRVAQSICDPDETLDWAIELELDLERTREEGRPILWLRGIAAI